MLSPVTNAQDPTGAFCSSPGAIEQVRYGCSLGALASVIAIPGAMPDILAGARVSLAIALILAVVTEMQASQPGLGQNILLAQRSYRSAELYSGVVVLGLLGFAINHALQLIERRALRWRPRQA